MAATGDERHDEGFYEASLANRNRRVSPMNSDGVDPEGRREAGQADAEEKCRVVRSRDLAVLSSTSSSDTASEISQPRNEVTEEERDDDASADMCQPSNEEAPMRRPRNPSEPAPEGKEKTLCSTFALQIMVSCVRKSSWTGRTHTELRKRGKTT